MPVTSTSRTAFRALKTATLQDEILELIEAAGPHGCISDDLRTALVGTNTRDGTRTARCTELLDLGHIFRAGDTRLGLSDRRQLVMRHSKYAATTPMVFTTKKGKNPFLEGLKFAARTILKAGDFPSAKAALAVELRKAASR